MSEQSSLVGNAFSRYLLSVVRPNGSKVFEVQELLCSTKTQIPKDGFRRSLDSPELFGIGFRCFETALIWIHGCLRTDLTTRRSTFGPSDVCILAELLRRKPLFPGKSHANQVQLIFEVMGFNSVKEMGVPVSAETASFLEKRCRGRKLPWTKLFPDATIQAVELLESSLMLNPADRPTAQEALQYSFFGDAETLYDYSLDYLKPSPTNFFEFEMAKITVPVLKEMIDNEVLLSSATNYRKPSIPTITVPSLRGRDRDQQPLSHPHSDTQSSRTDISSI